MRADGRICCAQFDLHCHSTASDGVLSPSELVARMAAAGVRTLALTDHDTTAGLDAARRAADAHGVQLINGAELSARWVRQTVHIVGLGIDPASAVLRAGLAEVQAIRAERAERIAAKLARSGVADALARATTLAGDGQVTRTHFARLLVEDGVVRDLKRAFQQYLGAGKPAYASAEWPEMGAAIEWIHAAGGVAVLAHPMRYRLTATKRRALLTAFKAAGGDALEVHCGPNTQQDNTTSTADALRLGLMASVGSDFHDPAQHWIKLGAQPALSDQLQPVWQHAALQVD